MASVLYCGVCTMPPEYCRYHPKYDKCLAWMKQNQPDLFTIEIKDISKRNPKVAKKAKYLWDPNTPAPEEKKEHVKKAKPKSNEKKSNQKNSKLKQTQPATQLQDKITKKQMESQQHVSDIQQRLESLDELAKDKNNNNNNNNNNNEQQQEEHDNFGLGMSGNQNKKGVQPSRQSTKKKPRRKKRPPRHKRNRDGNSSDDEIKDAIEEEKNRKQDEFMKQLKKKKVPQGYVEVTLEKKKGNKKVTVVRGYLEKTKFKDSDIRSAFRKRFATSVNIVFQNPGSDKGPKQIVFMGDKRYDFMKYLVDKFPKVGQLLFYKTKKYGLTPAVDPHHGFIMPPP